MEANYQKLLEEFRGIINESSGYKWTTIFYTYLSGLMNYTKI